jgi:hypothetical protein
MSRREAGQTTQPDNARPSVIFLAKLARSTLGIIASCQLLFRCTRRRFSNEPFDVSARQNQSRRATRSMRAARPAA